MNDTALPPGASKIDWPAAIHRQFKSRNVRQVARGPMPAGRREAR